jgi:drug/metabolite transporter (DMT)-like permease
MPGMQPLAQPFQRHARTAVFTVVALLAFAANSLLCRAALASGLVDPASFTALRTASGALFLLVLVGFRAGLQRGAGNWLMALMLFGYMALFSFAYRSLSAATGALLLFAAVQLTMFLVAIRRGERFSPLAWLGLLLAFAGVVYLLWPGVNAPQPVDATLMLLAGVAWGVYSLLGRTVVAPLETTALSFLLCLPMAAALLLFNLGGLSISWPGALMAAASGALASGLGYALWYAALATLASTTAATVQLAVPALAALGGVWFLGEPFGWRLALASTLTLGGIFLVLAAQARVGDTNEKS